LLLRSAQLLNCAELLPRSVSSRRMISGAFPCQFTPYFIVIFEKLFELRMIPKVRWIIGQVGVRLQLAAYLRMVLQKLAESALAVERKNGRIPRESD